MVAEGTLRHFDAAREGVKVVVVLWLPERRELLGALCPSGRKSRRPRRKEGRG